MGSNVMFPILFPLIFVNCITKNHYQIIEVLEIR